MPHFIVRKTVGRITGRRMLRILITTLSIMFIQPAWAGHTIKGQKNNETFKKVVALQECSRNPTSQRGYLLATNDCR
jgi:hypothetical protein